MKTIITIVIFGIIGVATISCSPERAALVEGKSGAQHWGETCMRCHNTPSPADFNDTDWSTIEMHMRVRANLTKEQSDKIFAFIKSANTTKTVTDPIVEKKPEVKTTTPVETKSETKIEVVIDAPVETKTKTVTDPIVEKKTEAKATTPVETKSETKIEVVIAPPVKTKTKPIVKVIPKKVDKNAWKAPSTAKTIKSPLVVSPNDLKEGKKIFTEMCVICHGNKGKGDGLASAALTPKPANFSSSTVQSQTDGELFWKMTNGNAPMAAYKDILTETQRWKLVAYLRTFKK